MRETDADKSCTSRPRESRGSAHKEDEMNEEGPTQCIPDLLQPFTDNLEDLKTHVPAHSSERERSQIRKVMLQKWRHKNGSTVSILTSP